MKNKDINNFFKLLLKTFLINKNVKKYAYKEDGVIECNSKGYNNYCTGCDKCYRGYRPYINVDYTARDVMYNKKNKYIQTLISMIKGSCLPIKYGINDNIIYFEYLGKQISFHINYNKNSIEGKKFNGIWNKKINTKFPFYKEISNY